MGVEADLLGDHRLAFGDEARVHCTADIENEGARLGRIARPVHNGARRLGALRECFEVEIKIGERAVTDVARFVAKGLELGELSHGSGAPCHEPTGQAAERTLKRLVGQRGAGLGLESGGWDHVTQRACRRLCPSPRLRPP